jgi:Flp pilus assembly protein CpaB
MPIANFSSRSPIIRLLLAGACGTLAMVLLHYREEQTLNERLGGPRMPVLIAKSDIRAGERVLADNLSLQEIPRAYVHSDAILAQDQDKIVGRKVQRTVRQNQALLWGEFDVPVLERPLGVQRGLRATPIPLGEALAKSHLLQPGDYIDVVVHLNLANQNSMTTTLLQRVQILELLGGSAMVALTPEQLESLVLARATGTITLAVRGREDLEQQSLPQRSWQELLTHLPEGEGRTSVETTQRAARKTKDHEDRTRNTHLGDPR